LRDVLPKSVLSISFSRGFGLTASQLGVALVPRDHPFLAIEPVQLETVDRVRRESVRAWLGDRGLPVSSTGSYYRRLAESPHHLWVG
jgi:hypothetical protein